MRKLTVAFCALLTSSSVVYATSEAPVGNATPGKEKSAVCAGCHGADGNSTNPMWPKLAGQHANYLVDQLKAFKNDERKDPSMSPMAKPLTDQEMLDLAAYFSAQKHVVGTADPKLVAQGERIYLGGNKETNVPACAACHSPTGSGNGPAKYPALGGQHAAYLKKQLDDYKNGARGKTGNPGIMYDIAKKMSVEELDAVTNYIQGLH